MMMRCDLLPGGPDESERRDGAALGARAAVIEMAFSGCWVVLGREPQIMR